MQKFLAGVLGLLLIVGLPVGLKLSHGSPAKEVFVVQAQSLLITPSILASGSIICENQASLVSEQLAKVEAILVKEGESVRKGQLLLKLDDVEARSTVEQLAASSLQASLAVQRAQISLDAENTKMRRFEELRRSGMIEASKYDDTRTQRALAELELASSRQVLSRTAAELEQARYRLSRTEIRSPISGKITEIAIKRGETAVPSSVNIPGGSLMTIGDTATMMAELYVDELDISRVKLGQRANVYAASSPGRAISGIVERISLTPRNQLGRTRTYPVRVRLAPSDIWELRQGMSAMADIQYAAMPASNHPSVPVQSILYEGGESRSGRSEASIFVLRNQRVSKRQIRLGIADDSNVEIIDGVAVGESVIVGPARALRFLRDGEKAVSAVSP